MIVLFDQEHPINMDVGEKIAWVFSPYELCIMDENGDNILTVTMANAHEMTK
jgi:hypothetical protein